MTARTAAGEMSFEHAVLLLRERPDTRQLMHDAFLDADLVGSAERYLASEEFEEVIHILGTRLVGATVVDVGAGTGIASFAFAKAGAGHVFAVEPDPSPVVGAGAIRILSQGLPVDVIVEWGENIGLPSCVADVVYVRQVLHHARDLNKFLVECARLLKPGGMLIASREHVVSDQAQLAEFLSAHPVHELTGSEGAHELEQYIGAIRSAELKVLRVYGPMESVMNAYPCHTKAELAAMPRERWRQKLGVAGRVVAAVPIASSWMMRRISRDADVAPGRLYSFIAVKPTSGRRP